MTGHNAEKGPPDDYRVPVRHVWVEWAQEQESPKPSWLVPWEGLSEPDREVDRRIGEALYLAGYVNGLTTSVTPPVDTDSA